MIEMYAANLHFYIATELYSNLAFFYYYYFWLRYFVCEKSPQITHLVLLPIPPINSFVIPVV